MSFVFFLIVWFSFFSSFSASGRLCLVIAAVSPVYELKKKRPVFQDLKTNII